MEPAEEIFLTQEEKREGAVNIDEDDFKVKVNKIRLAIPVPDERVALDIGPVVNETGNHEFWVGEYFLRPGELL